MAREAVEDLVVQLERNMDLATMEQGVRNILRSSWKDMGDIEVKWVKDNNFIITVADENVTATILEQVPWAVMKQNFSIKRWSKEQALEEVNMEIVPFWVQIRSVPPYLVTLENMKDYRIFVIDVGGLDIQIRNVHSNPQEGVW